MIAKLKGLVDTTGEDWVVVDVHGVGYLVHCGARTLTRLPAVGEAVTLVIETVVREDAITLYGFLSDAEKGFFRVLTTVQGVGAKVGLSILSVGGPEELTQAIAAQDKAVFTRAAGVGPKLAARIVSELKDKVAGLVFGKGLPGVPVGGAVPVSPQAVGGGVLEDALSALVNLGYGRSDAFSAVSRAAQALGEGATAQALIGAALKDLGQGL